MRNFIRKKEDFVCERCGEKVTGDGYTDHCPKCLWGKHVDEVLPGDRASKCGGGMEPTETSYEKGKFRINYRCQKCGHEFWVRAADAGGYGGRGKGKDDNREKLLDLIRNV
ncbi:MAG: RNHCP domain-containing protein [Candidatus Shapirobacteria bacterium]|jgi:hypothetical protein